MAFHIPFLSRLHIREYLALFLSIILIILESVISIITLALPTPIIHACYRVTRRVFNYLSSPSSKRSRQKKKGVWTSIANASDFTELCELHGYYAEEHIVQTGDGYLLGLHRLGWRRGEEDVRVNVKGGVKKKVVYLHHGLLMNSEVWVCLTERERCLPFELVERGYDVWLGNNRGNKYSKKSVHTAPTSNEFWNFSMDQFAFHDIPDSIDYILNTTHQPSLSYIGFSQGTAQAFATLSIHPTLNDKVDLFIALAPAMSPKGLMSPIVDSFVKASPDILFLAFGRRAILGSATMWQSILYPPIFVRFIDISLKFLFGWTATNITPHQKLACYPHLYSFTSTKCVVHWFQIIRNGVFQMYDDEAPNPITSNRSKYYKVAKFPTRNIKTPIVLVYGGSDSLVDINVMLKELPRHTIAKEIPHYEHLDFLWASSVHQLVFPHVFEALDEYATLDGSALEHRKDKRFRSPARYKGLLRESGALPGPEGDDAGDESSSTPAALRARKVSQNTRRISFDEPHDHDGPQPQTPNSQMSRIPHPASSHSSAVTNRRHSSTHSLTTPPPAVPKGPTHSADSPSPSVGASQVTARSTTSRPEGWWSSDDVAGTGHSEPSTPVTQKSPRRGSFDSQKSGKQSIFGDRGITLGVGKAVSGFVEGLGKGEGSGSGKDSEEAKRSRKRLKRRSEGGRSVGSLG
ncbi:alpha/beta-hydrolase [Amniculicola lignicola CBS 123094]|uniref:Alpha/beta-hydrolase n=1 Tax=Amniculicola lignicola CBS 123094 TaxID=1392246 RepID=A0A6A5W4W1_9PLEO|nr:alpha/beta-hydrolase [Amniculicola lignicola CBS 123094]